MNLQAANLLNFCYLIETSMLFLVIHNLLIYENLRKSEAANY